MPSGTRSCWLFLCTTLVVAEACGAGNVRPTWGPSPEALHVELQVDTDSVLQTVADSLDAYPGMAIITMRISEGYLETAWYDTLAQRSGELRPSRRAHQVRFRFWVDPHDPGTRRVTGEAVRVLGIDPSRPLHDLEAAVPEGHFGHRLVTRILEALREVYGG